MTRFLFWGLLFELYRGEGGFKGIRCIAQITELWSQSHKGLNIYISDSDLVWRMQLQVKNSCCVCREFLTLNAY